MMINRRARGDAQPGSKGKRMIFLCVLCALCGVSNGQQREVPGDRMMLDWFAYDREANTARWQMTLGALDANGDFQASSVKQTCALQFTEYEYGCEGRWATLGPVAYAAAAAEMQDVIEHAYHLIILIEQARQREEQAER